MKNHGLEQANNNETLVDRIKGTIYGQAIGDALGLGTEGMTDEEMALNYPNGITHYSDIFQDHHRKRWKMGDWTDDTDMMLCIANAVIVEKPFEVSKKIWEMSHCRAAANGGLMRTSVVGLFPKAVEVCAANICRLTHYDPRCVGSCVIVSLLIHSLVYEGKDLSYHQIIDLARKYDNRIIEYVDLSLDIDIRVLELQDKNSVGYTLRCLAAGLWAYWHAKSFADGLLAVVRAGGDADTNAAVACAILGAKFGYNTIPTEYVDGLVYKDQLDDVVKGISLLVLH